MKDRENINEHQFIKNLKERLFTGFFVGLIVFAIMAILYFFLNTWSNTS